MILEAQCTKGRYEPWLYIYRYLGTVQIWGFAYCFKATSSVIFSFEPSLTTYGKLSSHLSPSNTICVLLFRILTAFQHIYLLPIFPA